MDFNSMYSWGSGSLSGSFNNGSGYGPHLWDGFTYSGSSDYSGSGSSATSGSRSRSGSASGGSSSCSFGGYSSSCSRSFRRNNPFDIKDAESGENTEVGFGLASMQGWRKEMEDAHTTELEWRNFKGTRHAFFGVYDGHGGEQVANLCAKEIPKRLRVKTATTRNPKELAGAIKKVFMEFDADLIADEYGLGDIPGSTAVVAVVTDSHIVVGSTGDSRCVMSKNGKSYALTEDHKPDDPKEKKRIHKAGLDVTDDNGTYRVDGLAMSRSIGDVELKKIPGLDQGEQAVVAEPDIKIVEREDVDFLVLACDGIFDVMKNREVVDFVRRRLRRSSDLKGISEELVKACLQKGSKDNMSAVVVKFKDEAAGSGSSSSSSSSSGSGADSDTSVRSNQGYRTYGSYRTNNAYASYSE